MCENETAEEKKQKKTFWITLKHLSFLFFSCTSFLHLFAVSDTGAPKQEGNRINSPPVPNTLACTISVDKKNKQRIRAGWK